MPTETRSPLASVRLLANSRGERDYLSADEDITIPEQAPSPVTMDDLDRVIGSPGLMPPGTDIQPMGHREYGLLAPGKTLKDILDG